MSAAVEIEAFGLYEATFKPKHTDDLKPGAAAWIGYRGAWEALWIIDEGQYEGQWALGIYAEDTRNPPMIDGRPPPFIWAPECDLEIHATIEREYSAHANN